MAPENLLQDDPFAQEAITPAHSEEWVAKRRLANELRELHDVLVTSSPDSLDIDEFAAQVASTAASFATAARTYGRRSWSESGAHGDFGHVNYELNPVAGLSNPLAPPVNIWVDGDQARGSCNCGWAYEGPPGSVHGGIVAAIFDQFLGMAQKLGGLPGMTVYLHVNFHDRTPLNTELALKGWLTRVEGRKRFVRAEMFAGETLTASCESLFVQPRGGMKALKEVGNNAAGED